MYLPKVEGYYVVGEHPDIIRFMKGKKNQRPSNPRYTTTRDIDCIIKFLKGWDVSSLNYTESHHAVSINNCSTCKDTVQVRNFRKVM